MVLESTVVCVDNSEYMRNGDFVPSRLHAQQDAVNLICHSKTRANPENNVGLITLSDDTEVLVTLTTDVAKILSKLHQTSPQGDLHFLSGIKVAHLVLKHRQGKNHKMRIIVFVGSPIEDPEKELVKYGKRLRKEKVNVDVVNFGEESSNTEKLTNFINAINGADTLSGSHLVTVPPGPLLSDTLITSPIFMGEDGVSNVGGGGFEFGIDPNEDPELALALRVSMEEQRAQQDAHRNNRITVATIQEESTEEVMLKEALEMSMNAEDEEAAAGAAGGSGKGGGGGVKGASGGKSGVVAGGKGGVVAGGKGGVVAGGKGVVAAKDATPPTTVTKETAASRDLSVMNEEEQMAYALQMSMQAQESEASFTTAPLEEKMEEGDDEVINDPEFVRSVLQGLPGVDADSEAVKKAVDGLKKKDGKKDEEKK